MANEFLEIDGRREFILARNEREVETLSLEDSRIYQIHRSANGVVDGRQGYESPVCVRAYKPGHPKFKLFERMVEGK